MNKKYAAALAALSCALVCGLAGCSQAATTTLATSDATNASGNTTGAYFQAASLTADNDSYEVAQPSESEISEIYTFTLEGTTYTLPCEASKFSDAGWTALRATTLDAGEYFDAPTAKGFILNGDESREIGLIVVNTGSAEAAWQDCTVVGIIVDGDDFSFATADGISVGATFTEVQEAYGATRYDIDRFGTIGYHFAGATDEAADEQNWYGQVKDTLSFTSDNTGLYPGWESEGVVYTIRMENFGEIAATESE